MSWYDAGNPPINSTLAAPVANPDTATLIAELDSTQLLTKDWGAGYEQNYRVTWLVGASTTAIFRLEHALSTALASPDMVAFAWSPTGQSAQYIFNVRLTRNSRLRVRMQSTAANATAFIQAEALT